MTCILSRALTTSSGIRRKIRIGTNTRVAIASWSIRNICWNFQRIEGPVHRTPWYARALRIHQIRILTHSLFLVTFKTITWDKIHHCLQTLVKVRVCRATLINTTWDSKIKEVCNKLWATTSVSTITSTTSIIIITLLCHSKEPIQQILMEIKFPQIRIHIQARARTFSILRSRVKLLPKISLASVISRNWKTGRKWPILLKKDMKISCLNLTFIQ